MSGSTENAVHPDVSPSDREQRRAAGQSPKPNISLFLFGGLLPTLLIGIGEARFILNHFYGRAPYLLDSGWYSSIVYRSGFVQRNPVIACNYAETYYGVHISPLTSFFSILSYAFPIGRVEWYALFQGLTFAPLGFCVYLVVSRAVGPVSRWGTATTVLAAIAFPFSAQSLMCVGYPHYEVAIPSCVAALLACIVTGRRTLAWVFFVLALSVREDAGLHTGLALLPLVLLHARMGKPAFTRRALAALAVLAFVVTGLAMFTQKFFFHSANLFRAEYLGTPTFGHLNMHSLAERFHTLATNCPFITVPFIGSALIAASRRDARYLLGWGVAAPWFFINLLAHQDAKSHFDAYTGFPFLVSLFWVYLYGTMLAKTERALSRVRMGTIFAGICLASSIFGMSPGAAIFLLKEMAIRLPGNSASVRGFAEALRTRSSDFGRLVVDYPVAALAIETVPPLRVYGPGVAEVDSLAFHQDAVWPAKLSADVSALGLRRCTHVIDTGLSVCRRDALPLDMFLGIPTEEVPPLLAFAANDAYGRRSAPRNGRVLNGPPGWPFEAFFGGLDGEREVVWALTVDDVQPGAKELGSLIVFANGVMRASATLPAERGTHERTIPFVAAPSDFVVIRFEQQVPASYRIVAAELRKAVRGPVN